MIRVRKVYYFSVFLNVVNVDPNALFTALIPAGKGNGQLIFRDGPHDPFPACLEDVLGQQEASQLDVSLGKRKKFARVIACESGGWEIILMPFGIRDSWTEAGC